MMSFPFILFFMSVASKMFNTKAFEKYLSKNGEELNLNGMIGKNGILNQQGSILQLALRQNGEYFKNRILNTE